MIGMGVPKPKDEEEEDYRMLSLQNIKAYEDKIDPIEEKRQASRKILKEAGFPADPTDILSLLENKPELEKVLKKLNMKAFW